MKDKWSVLFCKLTGIMLCKHSFEKFFGLRDFIHFINYIRRKRESRITTQLVLQSLERNFNGSEGLQFLETSVNGSQAFEAICTEFLSKVAMFACT